MSEDPMLIVVLGIALTLLLLMLIGYLSYNTYFFKKIKEFFVINNKDELSFYRKYESSSGYSTIMRYTLENLDTIFIKFRKKQNNNYSINIETSLNNINYATFDLDDNDKLLLFKKLYSANSYVIFQSVKDIFYDANWKICNDKNYVNFSSERKKLFIRGLYDKMDRKPVVYYEHGNFSKNFKLFVEKVIKYYNNEGFELSVIRYKDPSMLIKFNRKRKLQILQNEAS